MGLFSSITSFDNWFLESLDVPTQILQGQFPTEPTENVSTNYAQHKALNRRAPVIQFLSGEADTISFEARFYELDFTSAIAKESVDQLKAWTKRDDNLNRPHLLKFWVGDGHLEMSPCVVTGLSGIKYAKPTIIGAIREVSLTINLLSYDEYDLDLVAADTRYHRAKTGDYYEMLSNREYGTPEFGDVLRKMHPEKVNLQVSNIVKLPSRETVSREVTGQKSLQLKTAYGRKNTVQRALRIELFDRTNRAYVSHIVKE